MKKFYNLLSFLVLVTPFLGRAQNVGVDVASPVQKLDVAGGLKLGNTANGVAGSIRWNGTDFQVHDGTQWITFGIGTDLYWTLAGSDVHPTFGGNVGIGTTTPATKLQVVGTARVSALNVNGNYTLPTTDGSNGFVLSTNGAGVVTWSDPALVGDITAVTAGNGLTGGGINGSVTLDVNAGDGIVLVGDAVQVSATALEGNGLTVTSNNFDVNVDNSTIQINADILRVPTGGITTTQILDGTIVTADIATGGVTSTNILDGTIVTGDIATGGVTTTNILDGTILTGDISTGGVNSTNILDGTIVPGDISTGGVNSINILNATILPADMASGGNSQVLTTDGAGTVQWISQGSLANTIEGDGLVFDNINSEIDVNPGDGISVASDLVAVNASALEGTGLSVSSNNFNVNVDNSTIEINTDVLRVKADGILSSHIAPDVIVAADIATGGVATAEILDGTILPADVSSPLSPNLVLSTNSSNVVGWNNPATLTTVLQDRDADTRINVDNGGSPDDDHIRMTTVNVERVTIDNTGEVGIGTNTPNRNLHVVDATGGKVLVSRGDGNTNLGETLGEIMFDSEDDTDPSTVDASAVIRGIAAENHGNSNKGGDLAFLTKQIAGGGGAGIATERMRILSTGNVGIGTTAPGSVFHVSTSQSGNVSKLHNPTLANGSLVGHEFGKANSNYNMAEFRYNHTSDGNTANYVNLGLLGNANTLIVAGTGNVGIGLNVPAFKLHVAGDIHPDGKIVVQNAVDGGASRGIYMWTASDPNWGIYMGQSGATRSLSGGTAVGGGGFTAYAIRTRVDNNNTTGIIFENSAESLLFSVRGGDGQTYHKGNVGINTDPSAKLHVLVTNDQNNNPDANGIYVQSNDNSGDNGDAIITTRVAGAGGGDPFFSMDVNGVTGWSMGLDNSDGDKLKFANSWSDPGTNTRMTIQTDGNVGISTTTPASKFVVNNGLSTFSRTNQGECCSFGDATIALADAPGSGQRASISFHNAGEAEGKLQLIQNSLNGISSRRLQLLDNQSLGLGLEIGGSGGVVGRLWYGNSGSRTETRPDAGLQGNAGAQSGFYETDAPSNFYPGASSWQHLIDVRHYNPGNNYAMQIAGSFFDQDFWVRKTNNSASTAWSKLITSNTMFTTFIQWGRTDCPASSSVSIIYSGFAASGGYNQSGSGANMLCLSPSPDWSGASINDGNQDGGLIYGVEFEASGYGVAPLAGYQNYDARCANCLVTGNSTTLMVPGTVACPAGWARQYWGYLMSTHYTQTKSEFVCVANVPTANGSNADSNGALWYPVEAELGALNGSGQVQNRELVCAVCTR